MSGARPPGPQAAVVGGGGREQVHGGGVSVADEAARLRWELSITAAGIGSFDWDLLTGELTWDERLIELFGYERDGFGGTIEDFDARVHPDDLARVRQALSDCVAACGLFEAEYRVVRPDGSTRWVQARGKALADADGTAVRVLGAAYDTTGEKDADARVARVMETMAAGFFALDHDWRFTYVNAEGEKLLQRSREELLGGVVWELFPDAVGAEFERAYRRAARTGEQVTFEEYYPPPLDRWYEARAWPHPDGLSVYFLDVTDRRIAQSEVEAARRQAEEAAERLRLLVRVGEDLSATLDGREAVGRLAQHLVPLLADWCLITLVDEHGELSDLGSWHVEEHLRDVVVDYRRARVRALSPDSYLYRAWRTNRPVTIDSGATGALVEHLADERARQLIHRLAPESLAALPMRARGRTVGLITLFRGAGGGAYSAEDVLTATELADRAGLAVDNARLFSQQSRIAEGLQRSLLTAPVEPNHLQVAVRYQPAAAAAQVGGDWYDAFLTPDGATVLVIGDVMGHDVDAAAAMGQVRSLLRGIAYATGAPPATVLRSLDAAMQGLAMNTIATAVVARLEQVPDERERDVTRLRWSNAGHPPPLLLAADGTVTSLAAHPPQLLLGVDPASPRTDAAITVDRGSTVMLYTDGLVERRGHSVASGILRLHETVAELSHLPLEQLCDGVLERLVPSGHDDDVALVAVRLHPLDRPRPPEAGPNRVPPTPPTPLNPRTP
ncbi:SpoIIE family protein phosphatase [Kineococcus sp. T13]|uniref:SpoIIE family protein phosphatase n=1 Tax=Kineococcus vitellinus TaxID=2696565 RepID=UPI0030B7FE99|nr:SpoIIE family protein phosphatase [Kineococcus vitellinus]